MLEKIIMDRRLRPQVCGEDLEQQGEVEQVVLQAEFAKARRAVLDIGVDVPLSRIAGPGRVQARTDLGIRKADRGRLVEIIEDL